MFGVRPEFLLAGLAGEACRYEKGGSSSASTTTTTQVDKRLVVDQGVGVSSDTSTVNVEVLDAGAVLGSLDLADKTVAQVLTLGGQLFGKAFESLDRGQQLVEQGAGFVAAAYEDAQGGSNRDQMIVAGALLVVAVVAVWGKR